MAAFVLSASFAGTAATPATAFELFGLRLFGKKDETKTEIVDPVFYSVSFDPGPSNEELSERLKDASLLVGDEGKAVSGSLGLISKARNDRERLVAALYENARYDGVVTIRIAGRSLDDIAPDAQFDASGPVPISIRVDPGNVFVLGDISLTGDAADLAPARFGLMPGGEAGSTAILRAERDMVRALKQEGRPLARVVSREVVADSATKELDISFGIEAGPIAPYGRTNVEGAEQVDREFIAYMTGLEQGETYSPEERDRARERLQNLDVFSSVSVTEADALDPDGSIPMNVIVSERKHRYFGVGATISSTDGAGIEGYWGHRNLFGRAEKLRIEGSISRIGSAASLGMLNYNAAILFEKPGVMGPASKFISSVRASFEHPNAYNSFTVDARAGIRRDLTPKQTVSAEVRVAWSSVTDSFSPVVPRSHLLVSIPLEYVYDGRDNRLDPKRGQRFLVYAEPTRDLFSGANFLKVRGEASIYRSLDSDGRIVFAARAAAGSIVGAPLAAIPADRRFYSGGGGSVRGYAYQGVGPRDATGKPTGGRSFAEASLEMRIKVSEKVGLVPFVDAGTVSAATVPNLSTLQFGAGLGLRYLTPFGPLRVDAAVPLNRRPGDPSFGVYAGIGQAF
ncbi:MAG: outer membrane protein assembly factor [Rhizobiaceae bacterium]|nr:outer membrane protein assembly factor [Rhizobiaceae bacterium]